MKGFSFVKMVNLYCKNIDVIILAGGRGTRLQSVVSDRPKPLAPINDKPFLSIIFDFLNKYDCINNVIVAIGYMADKIIKEYQHGWEYKFNILFSVEKDLLGTGGAIKKAMKLSNSEFFFVLNGDSIIELDLYLFIQKHFETKAIMTLVVKKVTDVNRYGRVILNDNNVITNFEEKTSVPAEGYINAGMYLIKRELFNIVEDDKAISIEKDLLPKFIKNNQIYAFISYGKFIDIGVPESYNNTSLFFVDWK